MFSKITFLSAALAMAPLSSAFAELECKTVLECAQAAAEIATASQAIVESLREELKEEKRKNSELVSNLNSQIADLKNLATSNSNRLNSEIRYLRQANIPPIKGGRNEQFISLNVKEQEGFCFLTGLSGQMDGGGERALLEVHNKIWHLRIRSHKGTNAKVTCVAWNR